MTWRNVWFQVHWLIGITAGVVLALVGFTGALLSFEEQILRLLNPGLMTVDARSREPLTPVQLLVTVAAAHPSKRVTSISVSSDPRVTARVVLADPSRADASGPGRRGTTVFLDPYTGALLGSELRGEKALHLVEDLHRRLAAGDSGKLVVGISTSLLLVLAGTGLYLRWPRFTSSLRAWFTFKLASKGRTFLWHLHTVTGTWVLLLYMLAAVTGLYWSFEWYRDGLFAISGAPRPQPLGAAREARAPIERAPAKRDDAMQFEVQGVAALWTTFVREAPNYGTATVTLPRPGQARLEVRYLDADAPHERAYNRLSFDAGSGGTVKHERYDEKPVAHRLMSSMFTLHSGSYFGLLGQLAMMIASCAMPLFCVTGWMLYLDRRRKKAARRSAPDALGVGVVPRQHAASSHGGPN